MSSTSFSSVTISLDASDHLPVYLQIARQIRTLIEQGRLSPGDRLPSSRQLAQDLGISRTTSSNSYDLLTSEGYLLGVPKKGVFIAHRLPSLMPSLMPEQRVSDLAEIQPSTLGDRLRFDSGADVSLFPHQIWRRCLQQSWREPPRELLEGTMKSGLPALRQAVAGYLHAMRGLSVTPDQVIITAGNRDAISLLLSALKRISGVSSPSVWLENPCYPALAESVSSMGVNLDALAIDAEGAVCPSEMSGQLAAILTPSRQYPLGVAMSARRRQEWLDLCSQSNQSGHPFWLIEDDYDSEFIYQGRAQAPLMNADTQQHTLLVGSFSKILFRSLRIGYIVAPDQLVLPLLNSQQALGSMASLPLQPALSTFLTHGYFATHLRKMRRIYQQRRDHLLQLLHTELSDEFQITSTHTGMHLVALLKPESDLTDDQLARGAAELGLTLNRLSSHYFTGEPQQGLLLGFSALSEPYMSEGVERLLQTLQRGRGNGDH
ncbi:PLP-dependent aminotransferase family protein [Nitrincola sp. MINF-07-Sa-05]|uniref:MocR-like pyridoxine biosynthesis transcription factor PdxR n=1 Tax=Nitrincola salilacus TaxID=3400273 RepID=UPI003917C2E1